jgi:hypothetical protein
MTELESDEPRVPERDREALVDGHPRLPVMRIAGGDDDDDDDDDDEDQGDDGHDDTGEDDHDLSNQDPDSDD